MKRMTLNPIRQLAGMGANIQMQLVSGDLGMSAPITTSTEEEGAGFVQDPCESPHPVLGGQIVAYGMFDVDDIDGFVLSA